MLLLLPAASPDELVGCERLAQVAHRHPGTAERLLIGLGERAHHDGRAACHIDALVMRFALLEPRGRAAELKRDLEQALQGARAAALALQAARAGEALGRLAYQQGEYHAAQACWTEVLAAAQTASNAQMAAAARIGLAQIDFAQGDWAKGLQQLQAVGALDPRDSYMASKLALNLGVSHLELGDLPAAERQFSHGLAAARRGAHREFEAEAHWHLARTALARQQWHLAVSDCRLVLGIAARHGYPWLEAAASQTWTEVALARGDRAAAIRSTQHGLALAQRIQARRQASQAHRQLAALYQQEGDASAALDHLWQHLTLQGELERLSPQRAVPAGTAQAPSLEAQLMQLAERRVALTRAEPAQAISELLAAAKPLLGLDQVRLWLVPAPSLGSPGGQVLALLPFVVDATVQGVPTPGFGGGQSAYVASLPRQTLAQPVDDGEAHGHATELAGLAPWGAHRARIEVALFRRGQLAGLLWLVDATRRRAWSSLDRLAAQQLAFQLEAVLQEA